MPVSSPVLIRLAVLNAFCVVSSLITYLFAVIDIYLDWCGPCVAMKENFRQLNFSFEDPDNRIAFYTVSTLPSP